MPRPLSHLLTFVDRVRLPRGDRLADLVAPPVCLACREPGADLCGECRRALPWLIAPLCPRCALPVPCGRRCPAAGAAFEGAWAPLEYSGPARALVLALKARRCHAAAGLMAAQIAVGAPAGLLDGAVLLPVPGHPGRARARGFDQAERLCAALARRTGMPARHVLCRGATSGRQVGARRAQRLAAGAIDVRARRRSPPRALLVDDVHTTGATLRACAAALRQNGAEWVGAVTYARTLRVGGSAGADNRAGDG